MEQPFKRNFLQHLLAINEWTAQHGASGQVDAKTMELSITRQDQRIVLTPQFVMHNAQGEVGYTSYLQTGVSGFVGWRPGISKTWPESLDKLAFKQFAHKANLRVPAWTLEGAQTKGAYLVKKRQSSFGHGQQGPFFAPPPPAPAAPITLAPGEYAEQFIVGDLVKAWYWNGTLCVAEITPMPSLQGDGKSTLQQLLRERLGQAGQWGAVHTAVTALWGMHADTIAPTGTHVVVDYRYLSALNPGLTQDQNVMPHIKGTPIETQLAQAGLVMHQTLPSATQINTAMTLDGVLDFKGQVHFLEVNSNPQIHPAFYTPMLNTLF